MDSELIHDIGYGWFWMREDGECSAHYDSQREAYDAMDNNCVWDEENTSG